MTKNSESFRESAQLFNKYQRIVHNDKPDDCDADQFYDFLVETPLEVIFYYLYCVFVKMFKNHKSVFYMLYITF